MLTLTKENGPAEMAGVKKLEIGVSWDATSGGSGGLLGRLRRKVGTDLDLVAVLMSGNDPVRFAGLDSPDPLGDGSVIHSGDNQTGHGAGDDETVTLELDRVSTNVTSIVFIAAAFKAYASLDNAANVSFKVYDSTGGTKDQVADIWPSLLTKDNACAVAKAVRTGSLWELSVLNVTGKVTQGDRQSLLRFAIGK